MIDFIMSHISLLNTYNIAAVITSYLTEEDDVTFKRPIINRLFFERARFLLEPGTSDRPLPYLHCSQRPAEMQREIDQAFGRICNHSSSSWGFYNGDRAYYLCGIDDGGLLKTIIKEAPPTQRTFYALDIGAGNFQWGQAMADFINAQTDLRPDINIHIISVRGESSSEVSPIESGRCKRYNLGAFKIEELGAELVRNGLIIDEGLDLVTTRWCMRHLVDPVGLFTQTFNLLRPRSGLFLGDGFFFLQGSASESSLIRGNPNINMTRLLLDTEAPFLMDHEDDLRSLNRFILRRPDERACPLSMSYVRAECASESLQIGSEYMTRFERWDGIGHAVNIHLPAPAWSTGYYALHGSRSLFSWLDDHGLVPKQGPSRRRVRWEPIEEPKMPREPLTASLSSSASKKASSSSSSSSIHVEPESRLGCPVLSKKALADVVRWIKMGDCVILHNHGENGHYYYQGTATSLADLRVICLDIAPSTGLLDEDEWPEFIQLAGCRSAAADFQKQLSDLRLVPHVYHFKIGH